MAVEIKSDGESMLAFISGEIDHHSSKQLREDIDSALYALTPEKLVLDFSGVSFMDSSGVGLVMGRYKNAEFIDCGVEITGLRSRDKKIMQMSGLTKLVEFR